MIRKAYLYFVFAIASIAATIVGIIFFVKSKIKK